MNLSQRVSQRKLESYMHQQYLKVPTIIISFSVALVMLQYWRKMILQFIGTVPTLNHNSKQDTEERLGGVSEVQVNKA